MRSFVPVIVTVLLVALLSGCGGKVTKTPESTARAYVSLMKAGKWQDAALLWDYDAQGRAGNSDWDTFSPSQRKLIVKESKWADEKATSLAMWSTHFAGDLKIETVEVSGDQAHAVLDGKVTGLDLVKVGEQWLISGMN
jgi:hypothetical protein